MNIGIPTIFNGVQFRSRLEARWAAVYTLINREWAGICQWQYEPFDLSGWIPDFLVDYHGCPRIVEVKPVTQLCEQTAVKIDRAVAVEHPGDKYGPFEIVIAGISPAHCWFGYRRVLHYDPKTPQWLFNEHVANWRKAAPICSDILWNEAGNLVQRKAPCR